MTPAEVAKYWRVSADFVRAEIRAGRLGAIDTSRQRCRRSRFVILPHHLAEWEKSHRAVAPPRPVKRRKRIEEEDFYPD
jgi:excisionase family DNA binding protein